MEKLSLFLLVMIIPLSSCDNVNKKESNSQEYVETNTLDVENKEMEEVKESTMSIDEGLLITAINELLYNPNLLGYAINGSSIVRTLYNNPMKIQRWIDNTRNSEYPFVFIKAKIHQLYPLEKGCAITVSNSDGSARELNFYVTNDEELYNIGKGDEVYFWALPKNADSYHCYFEIAFVSKYIDNLMIKAMIFSNLFIKLSSDSSEIEKEQYNREMVKMIEYSGFKITKELQHMVDKAVAKHLEAYSFTYNKYYAEDTEGTIVIDRSKGFMIVDLE